MRYPHGPTHGVQVWHRAWGWMGVDHARVGDCWVVLHTKRPALRMVIKPIPLRTGCPTRQYPDLVADHRLCVCTPGAPRRGFAVHLRQVPHLHTGKRPHSEVRGKSQSYWGHSEVVFGPIGCCVTGTRPHGPGNQGGPVGTCWARCLRVRLGGARSPASPSPTKQTRSVFRARVETLSPAQPHHAQFGGEHASPLGTGGPDATPTAPHMGYRFRIARGARNRG